MGERERETTHKSPVTVLVAPECTCSFPPTQTLELGSFIIPFFLFPWPTFSPRVAPLHYFLTGSLITNNFRLTLPPPFLPIYSRAADTRYFGMIGV